MAEIPTTQRAYPLRLSGKKGDHSWREWIWKTHLAVNEGAKVFGDWLLTLRGGIDHALADVKNERERNQRRIILALSWLSVESLIGAPAKQFHVSREDLAETLAEILRLRKVSKREIESWIGDCRVSLDAAIRPDAIWVNRSALFDAAVKKIGKSLNREEVWDLLERFFNSQSNYFKMPKIGGEEIEEEKTKTAGKGGDKEEELIKPAGRWLCDRAGGGEGADFARLSRAYKRVSDEAGGLRPGIAGERLIANLCSGLADLRPSTADLKGVLKLVGATGHKSRTRNLLKELAKLRWVNKGQIAELVQAASDDSVATKGNVGRKGHREWTTMLIAEAEQAIGFSYGDPKGGGARHGEFSVIVDHAARRFCMAHSWIKRAEANRQEFSKDAKKRDELTETAPAAVAMLDAICKKRSEELGAIEEYRIRRGAITDWEKVVKNWATKKCRTAADRIAAAREVQAEPENDKPGDIQLYERLAADEFVPVWKSGEKAMPKILQDYVAAAEALAKQRRFKVPAYRHPDALLHPVFCDFGDSRWSIDYAAHRAPASRDDAHATLAKKHSELEKAREAAFQAKNAEQRAKAMAKVQKIEQTAQEALAQADFLDLRHGLRMKLFDGSQLAERDLVWHSKRLDSDLALRSNADQTAEMTSVARADRMGRAAAGANGDQAVSPAGLFKLKEWNGRLQAPRAQLDAIAAVRDRRKKKHLSPAERRALVEKKISRLQWLITFSAKLQPQGPWLEFVKTLPEGYSYDPKKRRLYHKANKTRKGRAQLILSGIPHLRLLSVDLGHRFAAGCAVWETLPARELKRLCDEASVKPPGPEDLYKIVPAGKRRMVFRRIAGDRLDGSVHPAPWARLERQFLIKLQGEDSPARMASQEELGAVDRLERELGYHRHRPRKKSESGVDVLMAEAVRLVRLGISRLKRRIRIAHRLTAREIAHVAQKRIKLDENKQARIEILAGTLADWHELASSRDWTDEFAAKSWDEHVRDLTQGIELPTASPDESGAARKRRLTATEEKLRALAERLVNRNLDVVRTEWANHARKEKAEWRQRLRWLRDWLLARKGKRKAAAIRRVGGLSVLRITTLKELYQVQKAYRMLGDPDDPTTGIPKPGDDSMDRFGQRVLTAMERLRENRVKQLASRIIEAALGLGAEPGSKGRKQNARAKTQTHAACHAVVIENLKNYRPDETMTRRESRQLMAWASATVAKYLDEGCNLYGLFLRQVSAAYTSRQDSRTGAPGIRCQDVAVDQFLRPHRSIVRCVNALITDDKLRDAEFEERFLAVEEAISSGRAKPDAEQQYLHWLYQQWRRVPEDRRRGRSVRVPQRGGEIFVPANRRSPINGGIQADLNAAANIGLKAILDPDWHGAWWYVPVEEKSHKPVEKSVGGAAAVKIDGALIEPPQDDTGSTETVSKLKKKPKGEAQEIINLWRFVSPKPLNDDKWYAYSHYQNMVRKSVVELLREQAKIPEKGTRKQ
jgi:hypothetical protein